MKVSKVVMVGMFAGLVAVGGMFNPITTVNASALSADELETIEDSVEEITLYTTDYLRVRSEASTDSEILDVYDPDTAVTGIGYEGEWVKIRYDGGVGYMHSDYLTMFGNEKNKNDDDEDETESVDDTPEEDDVDDSEENTKSDAVYAASDLYYNGVIIYDDYRYTWYSENVLPGGGLYIPGRHGDENGYICDENDYICLASDSLEKGTVINTPFGKMGKVYDAGTGASDILDVYTNW